MSIFDAYLVFSPIPNSLNKMTKEMNVGIHLFKRDTLKNSNSFVTSVFLPSDFKSVSEWILRTMIEDSTISYCIEAAVLTEDNPNPTLKSLDAVISQDFLNSCPRIIVMVAEVTFISGRDDIYCWNQS